MAKKGKVSSDDKKAIKTTAVMLLLFLAGVATFLFLHKDRKEQGAKIKTPVHEVFTSEESEVKETPVVKKISRTTSTVPIVSKKKVVESVLAGSGKGAKIAFILDDWGYRMSNCHYLKTIKTPLAVAVLPNLRHSDDIMKCASVNDKDIMLHLPLEPYHTADRYPDYYIITTKMPEAKVASILDDTFRKMPLIMGVNNHMGSRATEDKALMKVIFKRIKRKGLFFVDSMTAPKGSICGGLADEMGLPFAQRDVFLDNVNTKEAIEKQMIDLAQKARHKGFAVAIGHDRQLTLEVLEEEIPILQKQGFEIVSIKDLLRNKK